MICAPVVVSMFTVHRIELEIEGDRYLEDRLIIDATAPDGIRRSMTAGEWHYGILSDAEGDQWGRLSSYMHRIAYAVEISGLILGVRRDAGYAGRSKW